MTEQRNILLMASHFAFILLLVVAGKGGAEYSILYTVENKLQTPTFSYTMEMDDADKDFYCIMQDAAAKDPHFRFESKDYGPPLGQFITSVNGLDNDIPHEKFWGFLLRRLEEDCKIPVGVSNYTPHPDDHVVLSYITYEMSDKLPTCKI